MTELDGSELAPIHCFASEVWLSSDTVYTFDDAKSVVDFCGPNDSNLLLIEELFGTPILTKGNELIFSRSDATQRSKMKLLVTELVSHHKDGQVIEPELIRSLYDHLED